MWFSGNVWLFFEGHSTSAQHQDPTVSQERRGGQTAPQLRCRCSELNAQPARNISLPGRLFLLFQLLIFIVFLERRSAVNRRNHPGSRWKKPAAAPRSHTSPGGERGEELFTLCLYYLLFASSRLAPPRHLLSEL